MRKNRVVVSDVDFMQKWIEFQKADRSVEELAQELGMAPQSVYQKGNKLRKALAETNVVVPSLRLKKDKVTKTSVAELAKAVQASLGQTEA
jgi:predicted DNA-binding protein YlxM (UPF0122 family)